MPPPKHWQPSKKLATFEGFPEGNPTFQGCQLAKVWHPSIFSPKTPLPIPRFVFRVLDFVFPPPLSPRGPTRKLASFTGDYELRETAMAFRKKQNEHSLWLAFVKNQQALIESTGLPTQLFGSRSRFLDFLTSGSIRDVKITLPELSERQFTLIKQLADAYVAFCGEGWQSTEWTALKAGRHTNIQMNRKNPNRGNS